MTSLQRLPAGCLASLALLSCFPALAEASSDAPANAGMRYVEANVQRDARQATAALGVLSLPVGRRGWVQLGGGQTRREGASPAPRVDLFSAATGFIGDGWNASLAANQRNGGEALRQTDLDASVTWLGDGFGVGVDGHHRNARGRVTSATSPLPGGATSQQQRVKGPGFGLHGHLEVTPKWRIYASGMRFNYDVSTDQGGGGAATGLLPGALQRASASLISRDEAALSRSVKLGSRHQFGKTALSAEWLQDKVKDEPGTVRTLQLTAEVELTRRWTVKPTLGQTRSSAYGGVFFGGIGVTHAW